MQLSHPCSITVEADVQVELKTTHGNVLMVGF